MRDTPQVLLASRLIDKILERMDQLFESTDKKKLELETTNKLLETKEKENVESLRLKDEKINHMKTILKTYYCICPK